MIRKRKSVLRTIIDSTVFSVTLGLTGFGILCYSNPPKEEERKSRAEVELRQYYEEKENYYGLLGAGVIGLAVLNAGRAAISKILNERN